jgi:hypothetical protein
MRAESQAFTSMSTAGTAPHSAFPTMIEGQFAISSRITTRSVHWPGLS